MSRRVASRFHHPSFSNPIIRRAIIFSKGDLYLYLYCDCDCVVFCYLDQPGRASNTVGFGFRLCILEDIWVSTLYFGRQRLLYIHVASFFGMKAIHPWLRGGPYFLQPKFKIKIYSDRVWIVKFVSKNKTKQTKNATLSWFNSAYAMSVSFKICFVDATDPAVSTLLMSNSIYILQY